MTSFAWPELAALFVINVVGMIAYGCTGFGENIIFQTGWYIISVLGWSSGNMVQSVAILSVITYPLFLVQGVLRWRGTNWWMVGLMGSGAAVGACLGVELLVGLGDSVWLKRGLGLLMLATAAQQYVVAILPSKNQASRLEALQNTPGGWAVTVGTGLCSGLLGGLLSVPGPPIMVFTLVYGVPKEEWRSSGCWGAIVMLTARAIDLLIIKGELHWDEVPACAASAGGGGLGLAIGNMIAPRVSQELFMRFILAFLVLGGVVLATAQTGPLTLYALAATAALVLLLLRSEAYCRARAQALFGGPAASQVTLEERSQFELLGRETDEAAWDAVMDDAFDDSDGGAMDLSGDDAAAMSQIYKS